jgi:hypothetical protein
MAHLEHDLQMPNSYRVATAVLAVLVASALAWAIFRWVSKASFHPGTGWTIYDDPAYATRLGNELGVATVWFGAILAIFWWYALPRISAPRKRVYVVVGWGVILALTWFFGQVLGMMYFCC